MNKRVNIFKPVILKKINNNETAYYSSLGNSNRSLEDPIYTLDRLASNGSYIFNKVVFIKTKDNVYKTRIAGRFGSEIVTIDGVTIKIADILEIKEA